MSEQSGAPRTVTSDKLTRGQIEKFRAILEKMYTSDRQDRFDGASGIRYAGGIVMVNALCDMAHEAADLRGQLAALMMRHALATGHGDTIADLLGELDWQLTEREKQLAEARLNAQPQNPCNCVPDGDDGKVAHLCKWHQDDFGKAYRMQNMADTLTVENIAKLPMDKLRLWIAHGIQESTARKRAEEQLAEANKAYADLAPVAIELRGRVERLDLELAEARREIGVRTTLQAAAENRAESAERRVAELERDARRYRWLAGCVPQHSTRWQRWKLEFWSGFHGGWQPLTDTELDAAIDTAIEREGGEDE